MRVRCWQYESLVSNERDFSELSIVAVSHLFCSCGMLEPRIERR